VTGLSIQENEVIVKRLEFLKQVAPTVSRIAYLRVPGFDTAEVAESQAQELDLVARSLGLGLKRLLVHGAHDLPRALSLLAQHGMHAVIVQNTSLLTAQAATIAGFAITNRLPTVGAPLFVEAGGLLAYGPSVEDMYRRAAGYVDRILKGTRPGDLPVEQPTKFELVINLKTAKALGLTIPPSLLLRADQVIE
jgi:putative ABC transport system substrate-binding protein